MRLHGASHACCAACCAAAYYLAWYLLPGSSCSTHVTPTSRCPCRHLPSLGSCADVASGSDQLNDDDDEEELQEQWPMLLDSGQKRRRVLAPQRQQWEEPPQQRPPSQQQQQEEEEEEEQWPTLLGSSQRRRFDVPFANQRRQQQQQHQSRARPDPVLAASPTIDDLLAGSAGMGDSDGGELLPSLPCSPAWPSQRVWLPQPRAAAEAAQHQQPLLDLISPAGPTFLATAAKAAAQQRQQITPGFYFGGSDAGSEPRQLTSLERQPLAACASPGGSSPGRQGQVPASAVGRTAAALQQCFDAAAPPTGGAAAASTGAACEPSSRSGDPIASLDHIAAFQGEAEAAVDRAARSALELASCATLRPLPAPAHLKKQQQQQPTAAVAAGKRTLLGEKENAAAKAAGGPKSKRAKAAGGDGPAPDGNLFAVFACSGH